MGSKEKEGSCSGAAVSKQSKGMAKSKRLSVVLRSCPFFPPRASLPSKPTLSPPLPLAGGGRSLLAIRSMRHMAPLLPRMVAALQQQQQRPAPSGGGQQPQPALHRFQCSYCSYSTNYQTNLNNHVRVHTGERPFVCPHCSRTFSRNEHLKKHRCRAQEAAAAAGRGFAAT